MLIFNYIYFYKPPLSMIIMTLLTSMISSKGGIVTAITKEEKRIILEDCAQVDAVFGLNERDNAKKEMEELQKRAEYDESKYYWIMDTKISGDGKTFAIPYAYFFK